VAKWQAADSTTTAIPALHYIAVTAQEHLEETTCTACACRSNKSIQYLNGQNPSMLWFLDIQVAHSTVKTEVTELVKYLPYPIHLGIDPDFQKNGHVPGTKIGSFTAGDINDAIDILAKVVRENKPPKVLVVHRFTQGMITDYKKIKNCLKYK
jgi:hypothetical protein